MEQKNNQGFQKQDILFYALAAMMVIVLIYCFGGLFLLILPWLGLKAMLG